LFSSILLVFVTLRVRRVHHPLRRPPLFQPPPPFSASTVFYAGRVVWLIFSCRAIAWQKFTHYHLREVLYGVWDVRGFGTHAVHLQRWPMFMMIEWEVCNSSPGHRLPGKIVDGNYQRWELLEGRITKIWPAHGKCFYYECG